MATVFFFGLLYVQAWTGAPAGTPPANNVDAPINVGVVTQLKSGALGIDGLFRSYGSAIFDGTIKISSGAGSGKVLTSDATGNASWQTPEVSSVGGGGGSSPYCAYTGQSHTVNLAINHYMNLVANCTVSVDATGYQTFSFSASGAGGSCSRTGNNQDSHPACTYTGTWSNGDTQTVEVGGSFDRTTGVLTCHLAEVGGSATSDSYTFTKDQSKCAGSSTFTETDPSVLTSVKDGVDWTEVTNKPAQISGAVIAGCGQVNDTGQAGSTALNCWGGAGNKPDYANSFCPVGSTKRVVSKFGATINPDTIENFICIKN